MSLFIGIKCIWKHIWYGNKKEWWAIQTFRQFCLSNTRSGKLFIYFVYLWCLCEQYSNRVSYMVGQIKLNLIELNWIELNWMLVISLGQQQISYLPILFPNNSGSRAHNIVDLLGNRHHFNIRNVHMWRHVCWKWMRRTWERRMHKVPWGWQTFMSAVRWW